jgi:alpha-tubulin suppressor-like RCC1 family protein
VSPPRSNLATTFAGVGPIKISARIRLRASVLALLGVAAVIACAGAAEASAHGSKPVAASPSPQLPTSASATATAISAGGGTDAGHTCALTSAGEVKCWGNNHFGELGNGTRKYRTTPVAVDGLTNGVTAITTGDSDSCALTDAGGVKCWGENHVGQLGDGTTASRTTPVAVSGLSSGVAAISAGWFHTCALTNAGGVKCWGDNEKGQLGDGTTTNRHTPVAVSGLSSGVAAIAAGFYHTCALTIAGQVKCWGSNTHGELGDGTTTDRHTPVAVAGLSSGVSTISAGFSDSCALTSAGGVECWGSNRHGKLGDGTTTERHTPVAVVGLASGVEAIAAGGLHSCALTSAGGVECWGYNFYGELGDGTTTERHRPVVVSRLAGGVKAVEAGEAHTCALTSAGWVKCWGLSILGDGTAIQSLTPVGVVGFGGSLKCGVPNVLGRTLARARTEIVFGHCRVGKVTRVASLRKKNTIVRQRPGPGKRLKKFARVNLKVSRGRGTAR